jgi:hypothetical protein
MFNHFQPFRLLLRLGLIGALVGAGLFLTVALAQAATPTAEAPRAPQVDATCFATPDDGNTVYSGTTAQAVREAVAAALPGGVVKIAGYCAGVNAGQVVALTQTLTLAGGYTLTNWATAYPLTQPTTLDAEGAGQVIAIAAVAVGCIRQWWSVFAPAFVKVIGEHRRAQD